MSSKRKPDKANIKPTRVVILLDRTGSMESVKNETISGFNTYLDGLKDVKGKTTITVVQFDSQGIDKLCDGVAVKDAPRLNSENYVPRAWTPLYDALAKTMVSTKENSNGSKVLFVTLTDGQENASTEWDEKKVKEMMKEREDKDQWTFAYIGIGPQGWASMMEVSRGLKSASNVLNIKQSGPAVARSYSRLAGQTVAYACSAGSGMTQDFWDGGKDEDEG